MNPQRSVNIRTVELSDTHQQDRIYTARCALALFIFGPAFPFVMHLLGWSMYSEDVPLDPVVSLSLIAEFFALALGFLGRRHRSGQVAIAGALIILACVFLIPALG